MTATSGGGGRRRPRDGGRIGRLLGLGTAAEDYRYAADERFGPVAASRAPQRWVRTTCGYCSVGCGMLLGLADGRAVAARGDPDHPVNRGRLCPKGLSEHHTIAAPGRLTTPLLRPPGGRGSGTPPAVPATWDEALARVAGAFSALVAEHGPSSVAVLSTGQLTTEEFYALGKLVRGGLGLSHYDGNTTLCMASAVAGYKRSFGSDGPPGAYTDFTDADCVVLFGANIADNHPLLVPRLFERDGAGTLVVVDPRVTKTAMVADLHLAIRPRTDITLVNGMMRVILDAGLVDTDWVADHTDGFDELVAHLDAYDLDRVAAECGVDPAAVWRAATAFGRAERGLAAWSMGVNHSVQGTETVTAINDLCLLTGNVGRPGAAPFSITGQCNAMGTREAGATTTLPGYRPWDDQAARAEIAALWGVPVERLPAQRGFAYPDIVNAIIDRKVRALWVIGTNPLVSFPNRGLLEDALSRLDLLVVQDGYDTPTTRIADVVLPAAVWGEKDGTFTNSERRVSRVRAALDPPGEARPDFDIFVALARHLGLAGELFAGWRGPRDAFEEWRRVSAGRLCDYSGITWERIDATGGVQWPCPEGLGAPAGTPRLYADGRFPTATGRARLHCTSAQPLAEPPTDAYPLVLNTGRTVEHWHTRTKTGRVEILDRLAPEAWVEVNPADARALGVASGDMVRVVSRRGEIPRIRVRVTAVVRAGEVFVPFHWDEACANRVTASEFDPISREPNYKQCAVRLEPAVPQPLLER